MRTSLPPLVSSEVDERQNMGMLASPQFTQKREASAASSITYHSNKENSVSSLSHPLSSTVKLVAMLVHERKSSRDPKSLQESYSEREGVFTEPRELRDFFFSKFEQIKPLKENKRFYPNSLKRNTRRHYF